MARVIDEEVAAKRQCAAYIATIDKLRRSDPDLPPNEADKIALDAVDQAVFGHDAKKDRRGNFIQQGIGSPGHETANHFASIRRWQGKEDWETAVLEIQKRDPERHAKLGLPKLKEKANA